MPETFDVVFRGGAVKGVAFIGALGKLVGAGHRTRRLVGTSAGAIFAACHAAGYTPAEMEKLIQEEAPDGGPVFASFLAEPKKVPLLWSPAALAIDRVASRITGPAAGGRPPAVGGKVLGLVAHGAACEDTALRSWLARLLAKKLFDDERKVAEAAKVTLREFHRHINRAPDRPQQLSLIATDITEKQVLVLNERTAPELPLVLAVRMSMSIPFAWSPVVWPRGVKYFRRPGADAAPPAKDGHLIVDGGVLSNFPIRYLLDSVHRAETGVLGPTPAGELRDVIGLFLDAEKKVPNLPGVMEQAGLVDALPALQYGALLLDTLTDSWDADALRELIRPPLLEDRVICRIGTKGFNWLKFDYEYKPDDADNGLNLKNLVHSGECAMTEFLAARR